VAAQAAEPSASVVIDSRVRLPSDRRPGQPGPPPEVTDGYEAVFGPLDARPSTADALLAELDGARVTHAVIHAEYEFGDPADDGTAELVREHPGRLTGVGTVSLAPVDVVRALRQVERIRELGLVGINIQPAFFGLAIDDRRLYPVYAKAWELELTVVVHTGVNYSRSAPIAGERPHLLDRVLCDIKGLKVVAAHGGWPWVPEMVAVARRHPNLLIDFGGMAPKYVSSKGSGWDVLFHFMNNLLAEQVLMASDWPMCSIGECVSQWHEAGLRESVRTGLLGGNAVAAGLAASRPRLGPDGAKR
jgi:predicted TIM-barrel fold metal-dependent hydrolase